MYLWQWNTDEILKFFFLFNKYGSYMAVLEYWYDPDQIFQILTLQRGDIHQAEMDHCKKSVQLSKCADFLCTWNTHTSKLHWKN